jgi:hypothetical protein
MVDGKTIPVPAPLVEAGQPSANSTRGPKCVVGGGEADDFV